MMYAMFAAVGHVFLVGCSKVANLLLDRAVHRAKEIGVRAALGASRVAIARQFMVEALLLAAFAAVGGALIAQAGLVAFDAAMTGVQRPPWVEFRMQWPALPFAAGAALLATLLTGLLPAIISGRSDINAVLKDQSLGSSGRTAHRMSRRIVVFEIALSSALLVGAALMTKSVLNMRSVNPGFRTTDVLIAQIPVQGRDSSLAVVVERLQAVLRTIPGVTASSFSLGRPGDGWLQQPLIDQRGDTAAVHMLRVTGGFFGTYGVQALRGRTLTDADRFSQDRVAVVNERFAAEHYRGDAIGKRIRFPGGGPRDPIEWYTIVGVVPNLYATNVGNPFPQEVLVPLPRMRGGSFSVALRSERDPLMLANALRTAVASVDADLPVVDVKRADQALSDTMWFVTVFGTMFISFGIAALILAAVGLYAVMAFSVTRREREMAIRMTLGADRMSVIATIGREGTRQVLIGSALGLVFGAMIAQAGRAALFEVAPNDPAMFALVIITLGITGIVACVVPAMRATRVDPAIALRAE